MDDKLAQLFMISNPNRKSVEQPGRQEGVIMQLDAQIFLPFRTSPSVNLIAFSCNSILIHSLLVEIEAEVKPLKVKVMLKALISLLPYYFFFFSLTHTRTRVLGR